MTPAPQGQPASDVRACATCLFWRRDARIRKAESDEHPDWRPCSNRNKRLARFGSQEIRRGGSRIWTAPTAWCADYAWDRRATEENA